MCDLIYTVENTQHTLDKIHRYIYIRYKIFYRIYIFVACVIIQRKWGVPIAREPLVQIFTGFKAAC